MFQSHQSSAVNSLSDDLHNTIPAIGPPQQRAHHNSTFFTVYFTSPGGSSTPLAFKCNRRSLSPVFVTCWFHWTHGDKAQKCLQDTLSSRCYLVDFGASVSVYGFTFQFLVTANRSVMTCSESRIIPLQFGSRNYQLTFQLAPSPSLSSVILIYSSTWLVNVYLNLRTLCL